MPRMILLVLLLGAALGCTRHSNRAPRPNGDGGLGDGGGGTDGSGIMIDSDGGLIFDPCVASPAPGYDPRAHHLPACCVGTGLAHCVPASQVLPALAGILSTCPGVPPSVCLPDPIIEAGGGYAPAACISSLGHGNGVCLSQCITLVANNPEAVLLAQDGCGGGELCVPCKSPVDGSDTGACEINQKLCPASDGGVGDGGPGPVGDGGPTCPYVGPPLIDPASLDDCAPACDGAHCLPAAVVPSAERALLSACTAKGAAGFCAPDPLIAAGGNYVAPTCTSIAGAEGRCLSVCLPSVAAQAKLLPQDVCADNERCAPCFNPTAADPTAPTGACTVACDMPADPPTIITCPWTGPPVVDPSSFPDCDTACAGAHCIPATAVPASAQSLLAPCMSGSGFCTPDPIVEAGGKYVPPMCIAFDGTAAEGRCLSSCVPSIAAQQSQLHQQRCDAGDLCAPCYDPFSGADTGACRLPCDMPGDPIFTFPTCCPVDGRDTGTCVPTQNLSSSQMSHLKQGSCPTKSYDCVPNDDLPGAAPITCTTTIGKGGCVSLCTTAPHVFFQDDCPNGYECIACSIKAVPGCT